MKQRFLIGLTGALSFCLPFSDRVDAARFSTTGPILTVTLKDPYAPPTVDKHVVSTANKNDPNTDSEEDEVGLVYKKRRRRWIPTPFGRRKQSSSLLGQMVGISSLSPTCLWQIETVDPPFPDLLPSIRKAGVTVGYRFEELRNLPCYIEGDVRLGLFPEKNNDDENRPYYNSLLQVHIKPVYHLAHNVVKCAMRVMGKDNGNSRYAMAQFHVSGGPPKRKILDFVRGSFHLNLPFDSLSSLSVTPSHDFLKGETTCTVVGQSGSGRTATVLDLNWDDPSLSIVHALDQRNTISPEISLYNAQIKYKWNMLLGDSGSINTIVDPTKAIQLTWTDRSMNGKWVTDFRLPLANSVADNQRLSTDIRVRRQFTF